MNYVFKKWAWPLMAVIFTLSVTGLTSCSDTNTSGHDYTVKVVDVSGAPYTTALVQPCEVDENGELTMCYMGVATDSNGVAYLDLGKEISNTAADEIEIHLLNLPSYYTYDSVKMRKGEEKTITITDKMGESGTGTGSFMADNRIDSSNFDPYVVKEGAYCLKFTQSMKKIYYAFRAYEVGRYKVYSSGNDVDASIIMLEGNLEDGLYKIEDDKYMNDNISGTDLNFSYEFEVGEGIIENYNGFIYFEVSLENVDDINKSALIHFEHIEE